MSFDYIRVDDILAIHADQIERYGGGEGIRDPGLLEAALFRPQTGYYPTLIEEAAALWESLSQNHPFVDGNKRMAFAATYVFLAKINLQNFDKVLFFDPDICIYASLDPVLKDLDNSSILLTPHYNKPEPDDWPNSDIGMMRFGSFNLGFFGIRKTQQVENYLDWWHDRCMRFCFFETQFGLSTDQKWINIAPCFFDDIHISFNSGYNMAFWNLHERILLLDKGNNFIVNDKYPLIFFHFSSFNDNNPDDLSMRPVMAKVNINDTVRAISKQYDIEQKKFSKTISNKIYGFDYMSNGEYISPTLRKAYASILDELDANHDPFNSESIIGNFARKNYLIEKSNKPYKTFGYTQKSEHKKKFVIIYLFLKILLRIMGPNNFTNFSRLLTYLSSYRQNRLMWKL